MSFVDKCIVLKPRQAAGPYRYPNRGDGRRLRSQTRDLYRVNFEVTTLKSFPCLAFAFSIVGRNKTF